MNIPYKNNKFINTLLYQRKKALNIQTKIIYYKSKDRNMKITGNKLLVFIVNIRKRNLQTIFLFYFVIHYFIFCLIDTFLWL